MALVFVIDDEPDLRDVVRLNLELEGHEVAMAADGAQALAALAGGLHPDLVLLDLTMPGLDGFEVLRRLKADDDPDIVNTPVVLLTGKGAELDRIRGGIEGAVHHLTKPVSMEALTRAVADALAADEGEARRAAQTSALQRLVQLERGEPVEAGAAPTPGAGRRVRFSRLERQPDRPAGGPPAPAGNPPVTGPVLDLSRLSPKQAKVLEAVGRQPTVRLASAQLGVSRSNVYASLRRIAAKLGVTSVHELVSLARERAG